MRAETRITTRTSESAPSGGGRAHATSECAENPRGPPLTRAPVPAIPAQAGVRRASPTERPPFTGTNAPVITAQGAEKHRGAVSSIDDCGVHASSASPSTSRAEGRGGGGAVAPSVPFPRWSASRPNSAKRGIGPRSGPIGVGALSSFCASSTSVAQSSSRPARKSSSSVRNPCSSPLNASIASAASRRSRRVRNHVSSAIGAMSHPHRPFEPHASVTTSSRRRRCQAISGCGAGFVIRSFHAVQNQTCRSLAVPGDTCQGLFSG